ncbi:hypothetical protein LEP1GSC041_0971 [Leptospira noguchii str. 2006001870]|nr:hypothetical protein LEP1GSC041_0971 [Leptospira noguchii str. 2006001870]
MSNPIAKLRFVSWIPMIGQKWIDVGNLQENENPMEDTFQNRNS